MEDGGLPTALVRQLALDRGHAYCQSSRATHHRRRFCECRGSVSSQNFGRKICPQWLGS